MSSKVYNPDCWEIVRLENDKDVWYRVLGGWSGGYLDGDSWRLSSGVEFIKTDGDYFLIKNVSGSTYKCHKETRGLRMSTVGIYSQLEEAGKEQGVKISTISAEEYLKEQK